MMDTEVNEAVNKIIDLSNDLKGNECEAYYTDALNKYFEILGWNI